MFQLRFLTSVLAVYLSATVFFNFVLFVGDFAVWNGPKHRATGPARVPECKKAVLCLMEETHVSDELGSGGGYSTAG